nr:uncharacterized protein LOC113824214 [Penaeus vannamei]
MKKFTTVLSASGYKSPSGSASGTRLLTPTAICAGQYLCWFALPFFWHSREPILYPNLDLVGTDSDTEVSDMEDSDTAGLEVSDTVDSEVSDTVVMVAETEP